ncbi:MAG: TolC family protein [Prevotella sp.]|nr:TolC family protein [Prevotella sp.]
MKYTVFFLLSLFASQAVAQQEWTMRQCMQYAVAHNHQVKSAELELDSYLATKKEAIGRFLPAIDANIGIQYNFGRAIDPETNGYTNVSTFYNGYSLQASLPVFDGFNRVHALRAAKAGVLMGHQAVRQQKDQTALSVLQAFVDVAYYKGLVQMATEKLEETTLLLKQTRLMEEVGRKSPADVALVESQQAEANYELTRQQNLYTSALLELKKEMAFPLSEELSVKSEEYIKEENVTNALQLPDSSLLTPNSSLFTLYSSLSPLHPTLQIARYQVQKTKSVWNQARAALYPSLSFGAGLNTTYYKMLHATSTTGFNKQLNNNMGEYITATLRIPLFNHLQTLTSIRKAKNEYLMARENLELKQLELEKLCREAWNDWQGYLKQTQQMEKKVAADSLAYRLTLRQFEEGLSTAIDLHTTSATLMNSKAMLLQCQLMAIVKETLTRYYQGENIWE